MTRKFFVVVTALGLISVSLTAQSKPSIQGVWRVVETSGGQAGGTKNPQPGLIVFTGKHYAIVRDTALERRPAVKDPANATAAEALATYRAFQAQAGTYEVTANTVVLRSMVAKNPPADGKYGNTSTHAMKLDGNSLTLTQESTSARGKTPNPQTIRLMRLE